MYEQISTMDMPDERHSNIDRFEFETERREAHMMADDTSAKQVDSVRSDSYIQVDPYRLRNPPINIPANFTDSSPGIYSQREKSTDNLISNGMAIYRTSDPPNQFRRNPSIVSRHYSVDSDSSVKTSRDQTFISKCSFYILICMVILSSVIAICASVLMLQLWTKCDDLEQKIGVAKASYTAAQQDPHVCLPCEELMLGPFEEDNEQLQSLIQREENNAQICCAKTYMQVSTLLNLFAKRKQLQKCAEEALTNVNTTGSCNTTTPVVPPSNPKHSSISAHLLVGVQPKSAHEEQPIRNWISDLNSTHLQGIKINEDRLVVPETGVYFLYSQVGFLVFYDTEDSVAKASQTLFHKLFRFNHIYPIDGNEELLRSEVTQCWEQNKEYGRYTSYVGAAVHLTKGDQLYVKVSRISLLSRDSKLSYFGLYKVH